MAFRNQIAGLVRFSYPARSGFARKAEDFGALAAELYDPVRLDARFRLFERLTIPSLVAQTDGDFTLVAVIGLEFPTGARDRLQAALARLPNSRIVALPPMYHYPATQAAFDTVLDDRATHLTSFRIDDDDAVDRNLIARLRETSRRLSGLKGGKTPFAIGFNRGFFLEIGPTGNSLYDVVEKMPLGVGLGLCAPVERRENIFARNHRLLPQFFDCWTDAETPAFIRTVHEGNDSGAHLTGRRDTLSAAETEAALVANFPFSMEDLKAL